MKEYRINYSEETPDEYKEIIQMYWQIEEGEFKFSPSYLKGKNNIKQSELSTIIGNNSWVDMFMGQCIDCQKDQFERITSQTGFKLGLKKDFRRCSKCNKIYWDEVDKEWNRAREYEQQQNIDKLYNVEIFDKVKKLSENELKVLKSIVELNDRNRIFAIVFREDYENTWRTINMLEKLSLICVIRNSKGNVEKFEFNDELVTLLNDNEPMVEEGQIKQEVGTYNFNIPPNKFRKKANSPDYSKEFTLPVDVTFEKGVEYLVGAWVLTDGSINIKFTPKDQVFVSKDKILNEKEVDQMSIDPFYPFGGEEDEFD